MPPLSMARWIMGEHLRRPWTWAALALAAAAWPAALTLGRLGLTTRDGPLAPHAYEIAFLAALAGVARGVAELSRAGWFLGRTAPGRRLAAEAGGLAGAAAPLLAAAWGSAFLLAPSVSGAQRPVFALSVATAALHLGALGLLALRLPLGPGPRALSLLAAAWVVPGLAGEGWPGGPALGRVLDAAGAGRLGLEPGPGLAHRWGALLPITALVGAAWLLAARAPDVHALRDPR